jgi:uncharacterized YigZ family protein
MAPVTPRDRFRHEGEPIKGSRFVATVLPVTDEAAARAAVRAIEAELPGATHHCWALRLHRPTLERAVDAGEPGGSAGRPILAALTGRDVVDACVVVTRWFGGTKLGVGRLSRAYGGAAATALDRAPLVARVDTEAWLVEHGYEDSSAIERALARLSVAAGAVEYGAVVRRHITVPVAAGESLAQALRDASAGRVRVQRPR